MITREIIIDAPRDKVFDVVSRFSDYPKFLKGTEAAKERKLKSGHFVDFKINLMKTVSYTIKVEMNAPASLQWEFVEGELMKTNSGSWQLEEMGPNRTKAKYSIDISFGWLVPKTIVEQLTKTQLPEMLDSFKARAEENA